MIKNKKILRMYLDADKFALGVKRSFPIPFYDSIWIYQRILRYYEYHKNVGNKLRKVIYGSLLFIHGKRLGFSISDNCFGPGLRINHYGLLIVNAKARIGKWCDIHQGVNIGENGSIDDNDNVVSEVPIIRDYCFIGPGAKIFGCCNIGNSTRIGANAVINKDVPTNHIAYGNPMKIVPNRKRNITIACKKTEEMFLRAYPQYKTLLETL